MKRKILAVLIKQLFNIDLSEIGGVFRVRHIRNGMVLADDYFHNTVTNEGINLWLSVFFAGTAASTWYIMPFSNNYTPVVTDTGATIGASAGEFTAYTIGTTSGGASGTRPTYSPAVASQAASNAANLASIYCTGTGNIYGIALVNNATQGSTSQQMLSGSLFNAVRSVVATDVLQFQYIFQAANVPT